ncbi:MAG: UvrD-helicase domain-containing protein, partial [Lachnospiraceae bacterium]|nr:UvrD-helicase domain-containing protein [Lachnospiraceae bacterium]
MSVEFTPQQKRVIDLRNCNILVSAAAGSGKTAVLTERIVNMICDETNPVDVDRLLVVTFTGAAAAEMRERIGNKLSERLLENPESEHLQRQVTLLHAAQITTIDSFCLFLIKNHFQEIGLDPAFRVADEREIKLLQQEVMEELLEDAFTEGREGFLNCVEALCPRGKERVLEEHILNLSRYAASFPWPKEWLKERKLDYAQTEGDEAEENGTEGDGTEGDGTEGRKAQVTRTSGQLDDYFKHYVSGVLSGCVQKMEQAIWLSELPDGPYVYGKLLEQERDMIAKAAELGRPEGIVFGKLPGKKDDSVDPAKRDLAKGIRDEVKKTLTDLQDQFFPAARSTAKERDQACQSVANELIDLVLSFDERMQEKKREKKLIDFTDMEHFALDILLTQENGELQPTQVARQYREYFHEILIDEYQDSNLVQEYLLWAVSGEQDGKYNRFMVGDVKQCIYHFRLARPELFLEKYGIYEPEGLKCKIDLSKNFRSRESVISTVNRIFERAMSKEVGGIVYDDAAALHQGAKYPELSDMESELYLVAKPKKNDKIKPKQAEAIAVAERISQLLRQGQVTDPKTGSLRSVRCKDIVILLRTLTGWGEQYKAALEERGIPAYVTSKSGYFTATEVQDVLNFLRVIDNPLQDVPLYGVLRSFFGGFTEEEIARVRGGEHEATLYESLLQSEDSKVQAFLSKLQAFREKTSFLPMRALLENIIWEYDYLNYVAALPGGSKRKANLE